MIWELEELEQAVEAARMLCDASSQNQYATQHDARTAPRLTSAVLTLVGQRLRLMRRAIHGYVPLDALVGEHNTVVGKHDHVDGRDVLLSIEPQAPKRSNERWARAIVHFFCRSGAATPWCERRPTGWLRPLSTSQSRQLGRTLCAQPTVR